MPILLLGVINQSLVFMLHLIFAFCECHRFEADFKFFAFQKLLEPKIE